MAQSRRDIMTASSRLCRWSGAEGVCHTSPRPLTLRQFSLILTDLSVGARLPPRWSADSHGVGACGMKLALCGGYYRLVVRLPFQR